MKENLKNALYPIYKDMLANLNIPNSQEVVTFCGQWGKNWPKGENAGILFVGKATNGWETTSRDVDYLFDPQNSHRIFARDDQMRWMYGKNHGRFIEGSAFWRPMFQITKGYYQPKEDWASLVAWSNLYKVSKNEWNPSEAIKKQTLPYCIKILKEEIKHLSPKYIIFFTSGWEKPFLTELLGADYGQPLHSEFWRGNSPKEYELNAYSKEEKIYIQSVHPQGKSERPHINVISKVLNKY